MFFRLPQKVGRLDYVLIIEISTKQDPKDNFSLHNIHILINNFAKHAMKSIVDCYACYHHILMDQEDAEKTSFITPWGLYHYRVMSFGLKNVVATYMRAITAIFHDMIHK